MAIDYENERLVSISAATRTIPGRPSIRTVWRWIQKGANGVKLESVKVGQRRFTSREAISRFIAACSHSTPQPAPVRQSRHRQRQIQRAEQELDQAGI